MSMARCSVITNCTNRKRAATGEPVSVIGLAAESLQGFGDAWRRRLDAASVRTAVKNLYVGRSFADALAVSDALYAELYVVSAGLGLLPGDAKIPNYNATIVGGAASVASVIRRLGASAADWWAVLNGGVRTPIAGRIKAAEGLVFIALPSVYLQMVADDLEATAPVDLERVRVFTSPAGASMLPSRFAQVVMPYDDRLEGTTYAGTRMDFPQRAMRHFVEALSAHTLDLAEARLRIQTSLSQCRAPTIPMRTRKTDDELIALLRANWDRFGGRSSKLLRFLRDEAQVACEQSRFRGLWASIRSLASGGKGVGNG